MVPQEYADLVNELRATYPSVDIVTRDRLKEFLRIAIPVLVRRHIVGSYALKVCSGISPDFAAFASANGIAAFVGRHPGHVFNYVLTVSGPVLVDLSAIQFECRTMDWDGEEHFAEIKNLIDRVTRNPFAAVKLKQLAWSQVSADEMSLSGGYTQTEALAEWIKLVKVADSYRTGDKKKFREDRFMSRYAEFMDSPDESVVPWMRENPRRKKPMRRKHRRSRRNPSTPAGTALGLTALVGIGGSLYYSFSAMGQGTDTAAASKRTMIGGAMLIGSLGLIVFGGKILEAMGQPGQAPSYA